MNYNFSKHSGIYKSTIVSQTAHQPTPIHQITSIDYIPYKAHSKVKSLLKIFGIRWLAMCLYVMDYNQWG